MGINKNGISYIFISCMVLLCSGCTNNNSLIESDNSAYTEAAKENKQTDEEFISEINDYFCQTEKETYKYDVVDFFMENLSDVQMSINHISSYEDGEVFEIKIQADDFSERYTIDSIDRYNIGIFYVTEEKIYALFNYEGVPEKEDFLNYGVIVCSSQDMDETIDGYEMTITNDVDNCKFSMWNTKVDSGYYCTFIWTKGKGLTTYKSGFGAERDPIEIVLSENN